MIVKCNLTKFQYFFLPRPKCIGIGEEAQEVMVAVYPLCNMGGVFTTLLLGLANGTTLIFYPSFDFETYLAANEKYKVTFLLFNE